MNRVITIPLLPLRACELCDHGVTVDAVRHCTCDKVVPRCDLPRGAPVVPLRSTSGACGLEAVHMRAPFLMGR